MKTLLSTLALLAALAGSATAAPYVLPSPQTGELQSYDWQPVYAIDIVSAIADEKGNPDMWGPRVTFSLYSSTEGDFIHEFNVAGAALFGSETLTNYYGSYDYDATLIPFTVGYDLHINIIGDLYLDLGANAGISFADVSGDYIEESSSGFTFTVGAGLLYKINEDIYLKAGYEYGRSYFERSTIGIVDQHLITLGVGCQF